MQPKQITRRFLPLLTLALIVVPMPGVAGRVVHGAGGAHHQQPAATANAAATATVVTLLNLQRQIDATRTAVAQLSAAPTSTPVLVALTPTNTRLPATPTTRSVQPFVEILMEGLNIRSGPGAAFRVIAKAAAEQRFAVTGQVDNCTWLRVVLEDGSAGWLSGAAVYSSLNVPCSALANVAAAPVTPSLPPATPTTIASPRPSSATPSPSPRRAPSAPGAVVDNQDGPSSATILEPPDEHSSANDTIFSWSANGELGLLQRYEVLFWRPRGETEAQGRGLVGASTALSVRVPVSVLAPDTYQWALWLVWVDESKPKGEDYGRIRRLAGPYTFTVPATGGGGNEGGSGGTNPSDPEPPPPPN